MTSRINSFSHCIGQCGTRLRSKCTLLEQTLPSKYWRNSTPRILLTVALDELPPVQRQEPEGKNANGLRKSILESWKLTTPQSYYQEKQHCPNFGAIRTKIPNLILTLKTWPTNLGIQKESKSSLQQSSKKSKTELGEQIKFPHKKYHNLLQTCKFHQKRKMSRKMGQPNRTDCRSGKPHQAKMGNY